MSNEIIANSSAVNAPTSQTSVLPIKPERLVSLDVLRGMTIAGMILVNNPGSWKDIYAPLRHAPWHGCTPTDLVFPFFLFMVGVAMTLSFDKRVARGASKSRLFAHVVARSAVLILLGWVLGAFPNLRLLIPFILMITGLQLITRDPDEKSRVINPLGWASLAMGLAWWIVDFRYFNGPTARGSFKDIFPLHPEGESYLRIPGVLPRIGLCYLLASAIALNTRTIGRAVSATVLMLGYWVVMVFGKAPAGYIIGAGAHGAKADGPVDVTFRGELNDWIDVKLLGNHLYSARPDPEGLLSTIPAIATVLIGTIVGTWILRKDLIPQRKCAGLLFAGGVLVLAGYVWGFQFPLNKKIWTSSYVLYTAGLASLLLAICYALCDILKWKLWAIPFVILGTNAIVAFFGSSLTARLLGMIKWEHAEKTVTLKSWLYSFYEAGITQPINTSLFWALSYVLLWVLLISPLYWKKIFVRV